MRRMSVSTAVALLGLESVVVVAEAGQVLPCAESVGAPHLVSPVLEEVEASLLSFLALSPVAPFALALQAESYATLVQSPFDRFDRCTKMDSWWYY